MKQHGSENSHGGRYHPPKFTERDIELMRKLYDEGLSCPRIADKFDTHRVYVWRICTYRRR